MNHPGLTAGQATRFISDSSDDERQTMECPWLALITKYRHEYVGANALREKGYEVFLPTYQTGHSNARGSNPRPLYAGYLFCRMTAHTTGSMVTCPGIVKPVTVGKALAVVTPAEIESVRGLVDSGIAIECWRFMSSGTTVEIGSGPLKGVRGILAGDPGNRRLVVTVNLLQRSVAAVLDRYTVINPVQIQIPLQRAAAAALR